MKKFVIIVLLIFDYTIGYDANNGTTRSYNRRFSTKNPLRFDLSSATKSSNDLVANAVLNLGINIFQHSANESNDKMQVISPLSIAGATSLIELGANGRTLEELRKIHGQTENGLNFIEYHSAFGELIEQSRSQNDKHKITVSNGVFFSKDYNIRSKYRNAANLIYKSKILKMDFQNQPENCTLLINNWVNTTTEGKIKEIVGTIEPSTKVVIASTLYFKALWDEKVGVQQVIRENFYPNGMGNPSIMADMLYIEGDKYLYHKSSQFDCSIIGLDYDKGLSTMFIILPNKSNREITLDLLNRLKADDIENMIQKATYKSATILIPKLHIEQSSYIQNAMEKMGVQALFDPRQSDLSLLTAPKAFKKAKSPKNTNPLKRALNELDGTRLSMNSMNSHAYVDKIIHKVVITVDEIGTEGGAATGTVINKMGGSIMFLAQTPFLFLIRHTATKLPLFYGAVFEPSFNK